jgi:hypothetical protein
MAAKPLAGKPSLADKLKRADFRFAPKSKNDYFKGGLSDGVMVTQRPLEALFMVRIHVGQPMIPTKMRVLRMFAQHLHNNWHERLTLA